MQLTSHDKYHTIHLRSHKDLDKAIKRVVDTSIGKLVNNKTNCALRIRIKVAVLFTGRFFFFWNTSPSSICFFPSEYLAEEERRPHRCDE